MLPIAVKDAFVDRLMESGNVSDVARTLGINRMTAYGWRDDPEFARRWDVALEIARLGLRERVVQTAEHLGLGRWEPALDPITGEPMVDDDFNPVVVFDVRHIDARVLMKLMDKTMTEPVRRVDQRTLVSGRIENVAPADPAPTLVLVGPDGEETPLLTTEEDEDGRDDPDAYLR